MMKDPIERWAEIDALISEATHAVAYGCIDKHDIVKVLDASPPASQWIEARFEIDGVVFQRRLIDWKIFLEPDKGEELA